MPSDGNHASEGSTASRAPGRASAAALRVEALLAKLEGETDPRARATILVDVGCGMRDELGDRGQAIDALIEAWRADPTYEPILDGLEPLVRGEQRWAEVLETTRSLA